jgi:hemolysin D
VIGSLEKIFKKSDNLEYEFLPPALEIEKTPPSPLGRVLIKVIAVLVVLTVAWSYFGKVDQVAVARGKIIPDGRVKVIQPMEEGLIRALHVEEGQRVREGQLLIELDSTIKQADVEANERILLIYKIEKDMLNAELNGHDAEEVYKKYLTTTNDSDVVSSIQLQKNYKEAREAEYRSKEEGLQNIVTQCRNEIDSAESLLPLSEEAVRLVSVEEAAMKTLYENRALSKMDLITKQKELNAVNQKLEEQRLVVKKARDNLNHAVQNLDTLEKERQKEILSELEEKDRVLAGLEGEAIKAKKIYEFQKLTSPVNGTVHGLSSYTIGGVVTPAQPVVTIVPESTSLVVEATALNQDIGFLAIGQDVEVKLDTFPFQKYGTIKGKLLAISPDAVEDEKLGPVYKIKVSLESTSLMIEGKNVSLSPGMTVSAEIKTGKRSIPVMKRNDL